MNDLPYCYESEEMRDLERDGDAVLIGTIDHAHQVYRVRDRIYRSHTINRKPYYRFYLTEEWYGKELIEEIEEKKREREKDNRDQ